MIREFELRPASPADAEHLASLFSRSRRTMDFIPNLHSDEEDRAFIEEAVLGKTEVTIALRGAEFLGFIALAGEWIDHLYVHPGHLRCGIGTRLLRNAMARADILKLWTFQKNHMARAFYERHGFLATRFTDGSENMEKEPDVLYTWDSRVT